MLVKGAPVVKESTHNILAMLWFHLNVGPDVIITLPLRYFHAFASFRTDLTTARLWWRRSTPAFRTPWDNVSNCPGMTSKWSTMSIVQVRLLHLRNCESEAGIKGRDKWLHPTDTVRCNNMSLPLVPLAHKPSHQNISDGKDHRIESDRGLGL